MSINSNKNFLGIGKKFERGRVRDEIKWLISNHQSIDRSSVKMPKGKLGINNELNEFFSFGLLPNRILFAIRILITLIGPPGTHTHTPAHTFQFNKSSLIID